MSQGLYLGRTLEPSGALGARVELDPRDLLTHGFIVGMTGSGKTGLGIALIEEALRRGVPVLAIDPKGDLGNLLLLFERLDAESFAPWVAEGQAAGEVAAAWRSGLAEWGLGPADAAALLVAREAVLYTPGSSAGVPLNVLESLEAPSVPFETAAEDLRDEIAGIVSGLLRLLRIEADPLQSREFILLSTLIESAWREGHGLTLESLVTGVADPPFEKLGALPLESVYPRKERQGLMLALNNLLASPAFEDWRRGEPLDVEKMLRAPSGKPRLSIVSTAQLSDEERLFVTALLLDKVKTWMRRQPGTAELRTLVYMDEIWGYFPPHPANPPTKRPLLTLLKQARAQGVGVVLATQNPVDLDYKGLANIGTWLVGKLQTQQDRERLREGLTGSGMETGIVDRLLDATRKRVFLLHDVHRPGPVLLHSRWALSYLRGPLTRDEIGRLMRGRASAAPAASAVAASGPPVVPAPLRHNYWNRHGGELADPFLFVKYAVRHKDAAERVAARAYPLAGTSPTECLEAEPLAASEDQLSAEAPAGLRHADLPEWLASAGVKGIERALKERLADKLAATVWTDPATGAVSEPGEERDAFVVRLADAGGGATAAKVREKLDKKRRELQAQEQDVAARRTEKRAAAVSAVISNLSLIFGRKRTVSGVGTLLSKNRLENTAEARVAALAAEIEALEAELGTLTSVDPERLVAKEIVPSRGDVKILRYDLVWIY